MTATPAPVLSDRLAGELRALELVRIVLAEPDPMRRRELAEALEPDPTPRTRTGRPRRREPGDPPRDSLAEQGRINRRMVDGVRLSALEYIRAELGPLPLWALAARHRLRIARTRRALARSGRRPVVSPG